MSSEFIKQIMRPTIIIATVLYIIIAAIVGAIARRKRWNKLQKENKTSKRIGKPE